MTLAQIAAVVGLLLAFGVPDQKVAEVRAIMEHKQVQTVSVPGSVILNTMKPAYTEEQLLQLFYKNGQSTGGAYTYERYWPISVTTYTNNAVIGLQGSYKNFGEVTFKGEVILTKDGNEKEMQYEGDTFPIHSRTWFNIQNLTPNTEYSYSFTWKESGREDTIISKTFKTKAQ